MKKILCLCCLLPLYASSAFAKFDTSFIWNTLETPHFYIYYHQGEEELAKRSAVLAEDVRERLVPRVKWDPKGRTHLVLVDAMDDANGVTTPIPYNHITLFVTQPVGAPGFGTTAYDEWLRALITHEYTHILQLDMIYGGLGGVMQTLFGRFYFPNQLQPMWMIEGLAVYEETEQTSGGRGRSPGSEMIIRTAALEDRFPGMSQAAHFPDSWPAGQTPYLFGERFTRYIADKYGREKLAEISIEYSGRGAPFLVESTANHVLKTEYSKLWDEWLGELRTRYARVRDDVSAKGLTSSLPLTKRGYMNVSPAFSPDGTRIAYTAMNADEFPGIYIMNADGTGDHKVVDRVFSTTSSGESIAWAPDGSGIYYTRMDVRKNTNVYNDIYFYDLKKERETRITHGLRARDPFPSPDGEKLAFVTNKLGKTRIAVLDLSLTKEPPAEEQDVAYLTKDGLEQYETPRYSPDGSLIVAGVWQPGGFKDLWVLDGEGNKREELMHDRALDGNAVFSPDGRIIYFASDRTGIFNLYAYELATKNISQITNVLGGAFTPAPSPDHKTLVFASYSANGFDLHRMPADSASWKHAEPYQDLYPVMTYTERQVVTTAGSYNPLPTLVPRFWLPWASASAESGTLLGFLTFGQDVVERHAYSLMGLYSPATYRKWYLFNYLYEGFYPALNFLAQDLDMTYSGLLTDGTGTANYTERSRTIDASIIVPLLKFEKQQALTIGYRRKEVSALKTLPPWTTMSPAQGILASGRVSYKYNNAKQYGYSISPENGRTVEFGYERLSKTLGGDFSVSKYTADWFEYFKLPLKHHVLLARGFAGASTGDVVPQRAFQLGGDNPGDMTIPVNDEAVYLRGYPVNEFRGRKAALASLEYRFPIDNLERGPGNKPFFFRRFHGAFFAESGNAWDEALHLREFKSAVGAEGRFDMYFAYYLPITLRIGLARALDEPRALVLIFSIWTPALF